MGPHASVIIPTRNRAASLEHTIRALWAQRPEDNEIELIVADNASTDDTAACVESLRTHSPWPIKYVRLAVDQGPAGARNAGARVAAGWALLFVDSDVELYRDWIQPALRCLEQAPDIGIIGGKLLYAARPTHINMFGGELSPIGLAWDAEEGVPSSRVTRIGERLWAPSSAVMVRRAMLDRIGLFDDTFYFGFEDADLGWRANLAGFRCVCHPDLIALHHATPSGRTAGRTIVFHYAKNRLRSLLKNYSTASLAKYVPMYLAYSLVEVVVRPCRRERLKALGWNVRWLRDTLRERQRVQRLRGRADRDLRGYFSRRLVPATTLARRRRDEWRLVHNGN
jgi:GT2 family glycosyltransferase